MKFKIGEKVFGRKYGSEDWLAGEIVLVDNQWGYRIKVLNTDYQYAWLEPETVRFLLENDTPEPAITLEDPTTYTKTEINYHIAKAYQQFDNDSQRLAYLQGCFAK